ncbi:Oleosin [Dillenia turbinata]|uniref:Oleosin n=1 Tax=Dillenia turbinata TaxID=194707 RepID=A0AAN8VFZ3_9MAGN
MADNITHRPKQQLQQHTQSYQLVKAATAATAGCSLLVVARLTTVAATVIGLTITTPLLVIFSLVLVPAVTVVFLLLSGFLAARGFGVKAVTVLSWTYRYVTGKHPPGADRIDEVRQKTASKAREIKEKAE